MSAAVTEQGWHILDDDTGYSALVKAKGRIDVELSDLPSHEFIRPYVQEGTVAIDVGAHIGTVTIPMMRMLGPDGLLFAFEPDPEVFACLKANMDKERADTNLVAEAYCFRAALGEKIGTGQFTRNRNNYGASGLLYDLPDGAGYENFEVTIGTLDDLQEVIDGRRISLIKIDCEGSEIDVIRGGFELINLYRPVLFVETNSTAFEMRSINYQEFLQEIEHLGYEITFFPAEWVADGHLPHDLLAIPT
jgi:FkbM family methyltransferase